MKTENKDKEYYKSRHNFIRDNIKGIIFQIEYRDMIDLAENLHLPLESKDDFALARFAKLTRDGYLSVFYQAELDNAEEMAIQLTKMILGLVDKSLSYKRQTIKLFSMALDSKVIEK